jgi:hypothetical protein
MPPIRQVGATFKKAERFKKDEGKQLKIKENDEEKKRGRRRPDRAGPTDTGRRKRLE